MATRQVRIGIDVGGTHTKAVAIDGETNNIIGKVQVMTTHDAEEGVAKGVVECFVRCLQDNHIQPEEIIFLAHSTTQATNALLEGDVANVGILAVASGLIQGALAKSQTNIGDVPLVTGRHIKTYYRFLKQKKATGENIRQAIGELRQEGAQVIVATQAFGVDSAEEEQLISAIATDMQLPAAAAYEISKLYGLTVRTRTAVINASILPKMLDTANSTQRSISNAGISAPLMIMRGDGGVMTADEMKRRPILSMLSGPTASVIGALMYLRASDGIYFEVGGTSTNIGVIKNGRPTIKYAQLGGYRTYVNSLDVRVLGVAGGSMVRVNLHNKSIVDVGPRSAHIAGMGYAVFQDPAEMDGLEVELFQPKPDDPSDYVCVKMKNGKRVAITNSCAANLLHLVEDGLMPDARWESANKALTALGKLLNMTAEETATAILTKASDKLVPVVEDLIAEYKLDQDQSSLVGCGGGAGALIPFTAKRMNIKYMIPDNADVISSIGVALAMVREVVERIIPNPSEEDIAKLRREAIESAIRLGADPAGIEVVIEIDSIKQRVRATATGSTELKTDSMIKDCSDTEAMKIAADSMNIPVETVKLVGSTTGMFVFSADVTVKKGLGTITRHPCRVIDKKGFIKLQNSNAFFTDSTAGKIGEQIVSIWEDHSSYKGDIAVHPDLFLIVGGHIIEVSNMVSKDQVLSVTQAQLAGLEAEEQILIVGVENG